MTTSRRSLPVHDEAVVPCVGIERQAGTGRGSQPPARRSRPVGVRPPSSTPRGRSPSDHVALFTNPSAYYPPPTDGVLMHRFFTKRLRPCPAPRAGALRLET